MPIIIGKRPIPIIRPGARIEDRRLAILALINDIARNDRDGEWRIRIDRWSIVHSPPPDAGATPAASEKPTAGRSGGCQHKCAKHAQGRPN